MPLSVTRLSVILACVRLLPVTYQKSRKTRQHLPLIAARQYDWSDGLYHGGFLNGMPSQYVFLHGGGIRIVSPGDIELTAKNIKLTASDGVTSTSQTFQANTATTARFTGGGGIQSDGDIKAATVSVQMHTHGGVQTGGGNTGGPNA